MVAKKHDEGERRGRPAASSDERIVKQIARNAKSVRQALDQFGEEGSRPDVRPGLLPLADEFTVIGIRLRRLAGDKA